MFSPSSCLVYLLPWREAGTETSSCAAAPLPSRLRYGEVSGDDAKGKGSGVGEWTLYPISLDGRVSAAALDICFSLRGARGIGLLGGMKGEQNKSWDSRGCDMICGGLEGRIEELPL